MDMGVEIQQQQETDPTPPVKGPAGNEEESEEESNGDSDWMPPYPTDMGDDNLEEMVMKPLSSLNKTFVNLNDISEFDTCNSSVSYTTVPENPAEGDHSDTDATDVTDIDDNLDDDEGEGEEEESDCSDNEQEADAERNADSKDSGGTKQKVKPATMKSNGKKRQKKQSRGSNNKKQKIFVKRVKDGVKLIPARDMITPAAMEGLNPDIPQRPLTAFKLFMNEFRQRYSTKFPDITFSEMTDIGAEVWRDLTLQKKYEFQVAANELQDEYLDQMREYQAKRQHERAGKPKTAYQIFMSDYLNKEYEKRKNMKAQSKLTKQDLFMRGVRKWNRMTKTQKEPYVEQSSFYKMCSKMPDCEDESPLSEPTPPKKDRKIDFDEENEVAQFSTDNTLTKWKEASKGTV